MLCIEYLNDSLLKISKNLAKPWIEQKKMKGQEK